MALTENPVAVGSKTGTGEMEPPCGLLCDLLAFPERTVIASLRPSFGWIVPGAGGERQFAYQVAVASTEDRLGSADLWDSGRIETDRSINIPYGGQNLRSGESYVWTVRCWSAPDVVSPWAEAQGFTIAADGSETSVSGYALEQVVVLPEKITLPGPKTRLFDFGRHAFGFAEIVTPDATDGEVLLVRMGELLTGERIEMGPPGSVRAAEVCLSLVSGVSVYRIEPPAGVLNMRDVAIHLPAEIGQVMPFRYLEVERSSSLSVEEVEARMVRIQYPFDEQAADFRSSDPNLDQIWRLCRYSILATSFAGLYVDGDRERIPYEADALINQLSHYAVDREFSMARRTHEYLLAHPTWPTEWRQQSILIAWADYEATGDSRSLQRNYSKLVDRLLLGCSREDGLLDTGGLQDIVDWPVGERDGYEMLPVNTVVNAFHYRTLRLMEQIAITLGRGEEGAFYRSRAEKVFHRFNEILFDESRGSYVDGEGSGHSALHANLFPLAFGLVPKDRIESTVRLIKDRRMACSVYAAQFLLEGLFEAGEPEYAIELMTATGVRSWRNMIDQGATITWEAWDQSLKPNQDRNHAWGAAPANIISRYILGVCPLEPGYGKIRVAPELGPLEFVEGHVPTVRGTVSVQAWRESATGELLKRIRVPANVTLK